MRLQPIQELCLRRPLESGLEIVAYWLQLEVWIGVPPERQDLFTIFPKRCAATIDSLFRGDAPHLHRHNNHDGATIQNNIR